MLGFFKHRFPIDESPITLHRQMGGGKALSFLKKFPLFNLILEKGEETEKERERNMNVGEKHLLVASCTYPNWGQNPQPPRHVPSLEIESLTFRFVR